MEDSQCLSHYTSTPIYWKQNLQKQLPMITGRASRRRRGLWSRNHPQTLEKRKRLPILHQMEGYPVTEATWENKSAFSDDRDMVEQYKLRHQLWHHHPWNNMPSMRLFQSMPNLKAKGSRIRLNERTHKHWVWQLEEELEGMILEYEYMDNPIKACQPLSTITINEILWNCLTDN